MAVLTCKICGGSLEIVENTSVAVCEHCGRTQTLPKLDDETRMRRYDRANHHRRNNDYDKAMNIYESILDEDTTDSEAYWSLLLCRYGIVYVEDQKTGKHIPTMNRVQHTSILADADYKATLQYADSYQKQVYENDAKEIYQIQKRFLEISQKEEPFDVFISYKDKDDFTGQPTQDRAIAMEIYNRLHRENLKVFFSHFTLDNKLGEEFEPYIFSALNSAKVMVVLGTKKEYFEATWVKNEWSRFHALIQAGEKKTLIAAYKNMDAYDLPPELDMQAQDMDKMGFLENLVYVVQRDIERCKGIVNTDELSIQLKDRIQPLLKRGYMCLEDMEWEKADQLFEQVLNMHPECAEAYLGKLLKRIHAKNIQDIYNTNEIYDWYPEYKRAYHLSDDKIKKILSDILQRKTKSYYDEGIIQFEHADDLFEKISCISDANTCRNNYDRAYSLFLKARDYEDARTKTALCVEAMGKCNSEGLYKQNTRLMEEAVTEEDYLNVADRFLSIKDYRDSKLLADLCKENAKKAMIYKNAIRKMSAKQYIEATNDFDSIADFKDSYAKANLCRQLEEKRNTQERAEQERKRHLKRLEYEKAEQERIEKEMREQEEKKSRITRAIAWIIIVVLAIILILSLPYIMDLYNYVRPLYICPTASHDNIANIDNLTGEISSNRFINRSVAFINII